MLFVVTEKGHNFFFDGKDRKAGEKIEAEPNNVKMQINMGVICTEEEYKESLNKTKIFEETTKKNLKAIKEDQKIANRVIWDLNANKSFIQQNAEDFLDDNPTYYDSSKLWWKWDFLQFCWIQIDEIEIINIAKKIYHADGLNNSTIRKMFLTALQDEARFRKPKETSKTEIQFKNKLYDIKTNEIKEATPEFFCTNPIPYHFGDSMETPVMDKLFIEWVGEEHKELLYQIIAYCCLPDYPLHHLFCFIGSGANGKSKYQNLLIKFIGINNCGSVELDGLINNRFESAKLYKKLVCTMGETNFGVLSKTSLLKKLTGQDLIGYEYKNKNPFDALNYAKILINSNSLPISEDTSDGFYRRWVIIDFPNKFQEGFDILSTIPEEEYNNLALKIVSILPKLILDGKFKNQGSIEERKKKYILASNPLVLFLNMCTSEDFGGYVRETEIYMAYCTFLKKSKKRVVTRSEFQKVMNAEGFERVRTSHQIGNQYVSGYYFNNLFLKENYKTLDFMQIMQFMYTFQLSTSIRETNSKTLHNLHNLHKPETEFQETLKNMGISEELIKE